MAMFKGISNTIRTRTTIINIRAQLSKALCAQRTCFCRRAQVCSTHAESAVCYPATNQNGINTLYQSLSWHSLLASGQYYSNPSIAGLVSEWACIPLERRQCEFVPACKTVKKKKKKKQKRPSLHFYELKEIILICRKRGDYMTVETTWSFVSFIFEGLIIVRTR